MNHLKYFRLFESISDNIELIEDCFLEFCDNYYLDIFVTEGFLFDGSFLPSRMIQDVKSDDINNKSKIEENFYHVSFYSKSFRKDFDSNFETVDNKEIKYTDDINKDFRVAVNRLGRLSHGKLNTYESIADIKPTHWQINLFLKRKKFSGF